MEREIDAIIINYNSNRNIDIFSDEEILNFDKTTMSDIVSKVKEECKLPHHRTLVQADMTLFKDRLSNILATVNHPSHTGGCAYLLDDKTRYREQVGDSTRKLPSSTK